MLLRANSIIRPDIVSFALQEQQQHRPFPTSSSHPQLLLKNSSDGITHLADLVDLVMRARKLTAATDEVGAPQPSITTIKVNDRRISLSSCSSTMERRNTIGSMEQQQLIQTRRTSGSSSSSTSVLSILKEENKKKKSSKEKGKGVISPTMVITSSSDDQDDHQRHSSFSFHQSNTLHHGYFEGSRRLRSSTTASTGSSSSSTFKKPTNSRRYYYDESSSSQSLPDVHQAYKIRPISPSFKSEPLIHPHFQRSNSTNSMEARLRLMGPIAPMMDGMKRKKNKEVISTSSSTSTTSSGRPLTPPAITFTAEGGIESTTSTTKEPTSFLLANDHSGNKSIRKKLLPASSLLNGSKILQEGLQKRNTMVKKLKNVVMKRSSVRS